jgi:hypothetical protein
MKSWNDHLSDAVQRRLNRRAYPRRMSDELFNDYMG